MLHELGTPSKEHEGVRGYCVPPSPLCCEFHQNGAIMGVGRAEERRSEHFVSDCDIV